ncbi:MAG: hypothetical protein V4649_19585 [Bacteroidota bacterium]
MFKPAYGVGGTLLAGISNVANLMQPSSASYAQMLAVLGEAGTDHTYMFLSDGVTIELIKVTQLNAGYASIERGKDGTVAQAFPLGTSLFFEMSGIAVTEMINAAIAAAGLPATLTFSINAPNTVVKVGSAVTINVPKLPLTSPDATVDVTVVGDGYGIDVERGAFGCCP